LGNANVCARGQDKRSFHIFYQILDAPPLKRKPPWILTSRAGVTDYRYSFSACAAVLHLGNLEFKGDETTAKENAALDKTQTKLSDELKELKRELEN